MVETRQELKGKFVTVTFLPEESSPEMEEEPGPEVTTPEVKPEMTTPDVKPEETTAPGVDSLLESKKTPEPELQGDELRQMDETAMAARALLATVSIRNVWTQVLKVTTKKWILGISSRCKVKTSPLL